MTESKLTIRARVMQAVSDLIYRFHWLVLAAIVLISVFMYYSYQHLELKLNFTDMLSPDDPAVVQYRHAVSEFGALSFLFVIVESDDLSSSKAYADELALRLVKNPDYVPRVFNKVEIKDYLEDALLFLPPRDLSMIADLAERNRDNIAKMVNDPGLVSAITGMDKMLKSYVEKGELPELNEEDVDFGMVFGPMRDLVSGFKDYAINGPGQQQEKLKTEIFARLLQGGQSLPIDLSEPYIVSADKKHLLMLVSSTLPAENFEWCRQFMEYVEGVFQGMEKDYPGVTVQTTGNAAVMRDDNLVIRQDMVKTTIVAYVGIMLLFAFSFRNLSSIVMMGVPLAVGILWSLGAAYWVVGHLTPITAVFGAILLGMGIDYGILILSRYTEERHGGHTIKEALDIAMVQSGSSILAGAFATSLAFFSLTQASFKGGQEMGIISGIGIIIFVIIMTFGLGSLLVAWDRNRQAAGPTQRRFDPKIMRRAARLVDRGAIYIVIAFTAFLAAMTAIAPKFKFEYNYLNLEPQHMQSIQLIHKIPEWFGIDTNYGMIISKTVDDDRRLAEELRKKSTVSRVDAISDFIPADQDRKLPLIARIREASAGIAPPPAVEAAGDTVAPMAGPEFDRLLAALESLRDTIGAPGRGLIGLFYLAEMEDAEQGARGLTADLDGLISALQAQRGDKTYRNLGRLDREVKAGVAEAWDWFGKMTSTPGVTLESLRARHPELLDRFQGRNGSFLIYAYPSVVIWEESNLKAVARELKEVDPDAMGVAVLFDRILDQIKSDLVRIALIALAVVFVVLLLNYRGLWHTVLTLVPLVAGAVSMVGIMNLTGLKFNIINTGMLPLVIGIGVDYGVYMVHRWIGEGKGLKSIRPAVESTGRAVSLAALTTMIGFASIILAQWRGLSLMGLTLTVGIGLCWIAAVVFLPAILKVIEVVKARRAGSGR
ncbi:MAG TPA: MMPL family transporter [bacterium]|nr:MMPL family transporter [bacterium]